MTELKILDASHLADVAKLEALCFSEPWSQSALSLLTRDGGVGVAVYEDGELVAYGGMQYVLDEGQITNIATHPRYRRRGHARRVVTALCDFAAEHGITSVFLEVRASNTPAITLYKSCGFEPIGTRRSFYRHPTEDAVMMKIEQAI